MIGRTWTLHRPSCKIARSCCWIFPPGTEILGLATAYVCSRSVTNTTRSSSSSRHRPQHNLIAPTVIYNDNHLLVVNKPPGWHSVPNPPSTVPRTRTTPPSNFNDTSNAKCLLTYLQTKKLGGGSQKDFLKPLHRIDQPCSGLLVFGKTSKAASRVTSKLWKRGLVEKEYLCAVSTDLLSGLFDASSTTSTSMSPTTATLISNTSEDWYKLDGLLIRPKHGTMDGSTNTTKKRPPKPKRSVTILPTTIHHGTRTHDNNDDPNNKMYREVELYWRIFSGRHIDDTGGGVPSQSQYTIIHVRTNQGARHQVRALLAQVGDCPIAGDVRYGNVHSSNSQPLPDKSVALHAWKINFCDPKFKLGSMEGTMEFEAPIPETWKTYFFQ